MVKEGDPMGEDSPGELLKLVSRLPGKRVLVVGDLCLDEYIVGRARRLSREAPVPVLEFERQFAVPGAGANPALNISALGGFATIVGVVGDDEGGRTLRQLLQAPGIDSRGVIIDPSRGTTVKTRVMAEASLRFPQQLMRIDRQTGRELDAQVMDQVVAVVRAATPLADAVLFSDYKGGVVSQSVVETSAEVCRAQSKISTADSQGDLFKFKRLNVVKCNQQEAEAALAVKLDREESFHEAASSLIGRLGVEAVVITRGGEGISLLDARGGYAHIPAANRSEVFDVTGAGDTVIAVLTMALAAGASEYQATCLANIAAGLVVRRLGNVTTTIEELSAAIQGLSDRGDA